MTDVLVVERLEASLDRDVLLLAPGTYLPPGAIERLAACARREPLAATVSPFANGGGVAAYPRMGFDNPLLDEAGVAALDAIFAAENRGAVVDVPVGSEACLFVTRRALEAAGDFDSPRDLCLRAARAGLRNVVCGEVYVGHPAWPAKSDAPPADLDAALRSFRARDPIRPLRRRVDVARLRASVRPRLLLVSHRSGGGVERHVRDLAALLEPHREVLLLRPAPGGSVELSWLRAGEEFQAWFDVAEWSLLVDLLRSLGVARVHLHHVDGLPRDILDLPAVLGVPYDLTLHDYYPACPRYHLTDAHGRYCGEERDCRRCLEGGEPRWGLDLDAWRATFGDFLARADRRIAPTQDVARRLAAYFPQVPVRVLAHPEEAPAGRPPFKIAVLGAVSRIKGADVLEACVRDARERTLPLHFHVVGYLGQSMPEWPEAPLTVGGAYPEGRLDEAIAIARPQAFLFLSQVPETWSYTLTAALRTGLPIVAPDRGAFAERLAGVPQALRLAPDLPAAALNDALLALLL